MQTRLSSQPSSSRTVHCKRSKCSPVKLPELLKRACPWRRNSIYSQPFAGLREREAKLCKAISTSAGAGEEKGLSGISRAVFIQNKSEKIWACSYLEMPYHNSPNSFHKKHGRCNVCSLLLKKNPRENDILTTHFNSKYRMVFTSQRQCLSLLTMNPVFSTFAIANRMAGATMKCGTKYFQKVRQIVSITGLSLTRKNCNVNTPPSAKDSEPPRSRRFTLTKFITLRRKLLTSSCSDCLLNTY